MSKYVFECIDAHTCGNPVRVIKHGAPMLKGSSMSEMRQHFLKEFDWIRKGLMFEPRGHDMMSGSLLYPPHDPSNDFGIIFIETSGCLPMCGHGTIGTITVAIQEGLVKPKVEGVVKMEAPAGVINIEYGKKGDKVDWVKLTNVKSYLAEEGLEVNCPELGKIIFDVAYGGNFYAIIDPQKNFSGIQDFSGAELIRFSQILRQRIKERYPNCFVHPEDETIRNVTHVLWTGEPIDPTSSGRSAVFYGDKAIDRSPCGTGTSARMAQLFDKGQLKVGEQFVHESFIGSKFIGCIENAIPFHGKSAVIPSIKGWAKVFGHITIVIDREDDPYALGFQVIL